VKILHVITGLDQGGAEGLLYRLVSASSASAGHAVVSLQDEGIYGDRLRRAGASVHALAMPRGRVSWRGVRALYRIIRQERPDVIHGWMLHANLLAGAVGRVAGTRAVIWTVLNPDLDRSRNNWSTRAVGHLLAAGSRFVPAAAIFVSESSRLAHEAVGFRPPKTIIIRNAVDIMEFQPDGAARRRVRGEWRVSDGEMLLGFVARWDVHKDHRTLLDALSRVPPAARPFRCAFVGPGMEEGNPELMAVIARLGLQPSVILAGAREDIPAVMNALDVHVLSSVMEAGPNVVLEAMACGTPCVVSDVGAAALMVEDTGWVVPPGAPAAMAAAIETAIATIRRDGRDALARRCRERVAAQFSQELTLGQYLDLWHGVAAT
jgi:glycosyltransferase involved in cell wall biosynthesis